jgi:hypothetical protein
MSGRSVRSSSELLSGSLRDIRDAQALKANNAVVATVPGRQTEFH